MVNQSNTAKFDDYLNLWQSYIYIFHSIFFCNMLTVLVCYLYFVSLILNSCYSVKINECLYTRQQLHGSLQGQIQNNLKISGDNFERKYVSSRLINYYLANCYSPYTQTYEKFTETSFITDKAGEYEKMKTYQRSFGLPVFVFVLLDNSIQKLTRIYIIVILLKHRYRDIQCLEKG